MRHATGVIGSIGLGLQCGERGRKYTTAKPRARRKLSKRGSGDSSGRMCVEFVLFRTITLYE